MVSDEQITGLSSLTPQLTFQGGAEPWRVVHLHKMCTRLSACTCSSSTASPRSRRSSTGQKLGSSSPSRAFIFPVGFCSASPSWLMTRSRRVPFSRCVTLWPQAWMWTCMQIVCAISPGVTRTVYHGPQTGGFNHRHVLSPSSGHQKAKSKASAGLAPPEASPPTPCSPCVLTRSSCGCLCPDPLFSCRHRWHWIRAHPDDLILP